MQVNRSNFANNIFLFEKKKINQLPYCQSRFKGKININKLRNNFPHKNDININDYLIIICVRLCVNSRKRKSLHRQYRSEDGGSEKSIICYLQSSQLPCMHIFINTCSSNVQYVVDYTHSFLFVILLLLFFKIHIMLITRPVRLTQI